MIVLQIAEFLNLSVKCDEVDVAGICCFYFFDEGQRLFIPSFICLAEGVDEPAGQRGMTGIGVTLNAHHTMLRY